MKVLSEIGVLWCNGCSYATYEKMIYSNRIRSSSVTAHISSAFAPSSGTRFRCTFVPRCYLFGSNKPTRYQLRGCLVFRFLQVRLNRCHYSWRVYFSAVSLRFTTNSQSKIGNFAMPLNGFNIETACGRHWSNRNFALLQNKNARPLAVKLKL